MDMERLSWTVVLGLVSSIFFWPGVVQAAEVQMIYSPEFKAQWTAELVNQGKSVHGTMQILSEFLTREETSGLNEILKKSGIDETRPLSGINAVGARVSFGAPSSTLEFLSNGSMKIGGKVFGASKNEPVDEYARRVLHDLDPKRFGMSWRGSLFLPEAQAQLGAVASVGEPLLVLAIVVGGATLAYTGIKDFLYGMKNPSVSCVSEDAYSSLFKSKTLNIKPPPERDRIFKVQDGQRPPVYVVSHPDKLDTGSLMRCDEASKAKVKHTMSHPGSYSGMIREIENPTKMK